MEVLTMENKEGGVKKLLEQKAAYNPLKCMLITFTVLFTHPPEPIRTDQNWSDLISSKWKQVII